MEATRVDRIPEGDVWQFEPKWDGFRAIVFRDDDEVSIQSKAGQPLARYFPELVEAFQAVKAKNFVLDGEIVIPVELRDWFNKYSGLGFDGVMAKRLGEPYHSGDREGMVKVKHLKTADCVVGGFRYGEGTKTVGSLLLGLYDDDGRLVYIGHTSSIKKADRKALTSKLEALRGKNPFEVRVPGGPNRWATERSGEWEPLKLKLVCEVEYDYFSQGRFRHGSKFLRWRPDKAPKQCTMEQVMPRDEGRGMRDAERLLSR